MKEDFLPSLRSACSSLAFLPWLALLGWLFATAWFLCDDAFISFRYARNLLEGRSLVFNPGEHVEGCTNLLWVLEPAALWEALGIPPEQAAPWLSVACTAGTIAALGVWWAACRSCAIGGWPPGRPSAFSAPAPPSRCGPRAAGWGPRR